MKEIVDYLFANRDEKYAAFQAPIIPSVESQRIIGVRTPVLRDYAKALSKSEIKEEYLSELPHTFFEENQLHAFLIASEKDFNRCIELLESFLPYVDNWATCDQLNPKCFKKHYDKLDKLADEWINSKHIYEVRFGIKVRMDHFLDGNFDSKYPRYISTIRSDEYYINMMIAWYFATALAKQYDAIIPFIENYSLDKWTHNKSIQKAIESYRITEEQKAYLRTLKIK